MKMPDSVKTSKLRAIKNELLEASNSPLFQYRQSNNYFPVIGEGDHGAQIMFIGEAPGKNEALSGRPFCGAAGKVLDELLLSINLRRDQVYITNIVKDRPPDNRDPKPEEIAYYAPYLNRQIEIISPRVIATLGRFSMQYILENFNLPERFKSISHLHGQKIFCAPPSKMIIIPLFHPAAAIYNRSLRGTLESDFQVLKEYI